MRWLKSDCFLQWSCLDIMSSSLMFKKLLLLSKRGCLWISLHLISSSNNFSIVQFTTIKMRSDAKKITFYRCITNVSTVRGVCFLLWKKSCYLAENSHCFNWCSIWKIRRGYTYCIAKQASLLLRIRFHD